MTNLEKAFNGGMTYEEAQELFSKLSTDEALELLQDDLACCDECIFLIETNLLDYKDYGAKCQTIKLDPIAQEIEVKIEKYDHDLIVKFSDCEVEPFIDYDTTEQDDLRDEKEYSLRMLDGLGDLVGDIRILF